MNLPLYTIWYDGFDGKLNNLYAYTTATANNIVWNLHKQHYTNIEVWLTNSMTDVTNEFKRLM